MENRNNSLESIIRAAKEMALRRNQERRNQEDKIQTDKNQADKNQENKQDVISSPNTDNSLSDTSAVLSAGAVIDAAKEVPMDAAIETSVDAVEDTAVDAIEDTAVDAVEEMPVDIVEASAVDAAEETTFDAVTKTAAETAVITPAESAEEEPAKEMIEEPEDTPEENSAGTSNEEAEDTPLDFSNTDALFSAARSFAATLETASVHFLEFSVAFLAMIKRHYQQDGGDIRANSMAFFALIALDSWSDNEYTMSDLADKLQIPKQQLTKLINDLETRGLVERSHDTENRRRVYIRIREEGRLLMDQVKQDMLESTLYGLRAYTTEELLEMDACICRLTQLMEKFNTEP